MRRNQHPLPRSDTRGNQLMPAWQKTRHRVFEAFGEGKLLFRDVFIARVFPRITGVCPPPASAGEYRNSGARVSPVARHTSLPFQLC